MIIVLSLYPQSLKTLHNRKYPILLFLLEIGSVWGVWRQTSADCIWSGNSEEKKDIKERVQQIKITKTSLNIKCINLNIYIYACIYYFNLVASIVWYFTFLAVLSSNWKCFFFTIIECPSSPHCSDVRSLPVTRSSLSPSPMTRSTCWHREVPRTISWSTSSGRRAR